MTLVFFLLGAALAVVVLLLLVPVLWRGKKGAAHTARSAVNAAIHRDQLAELERDRAAGVLSDADFEQARRELQRRVLEEATPTGEEASGTVRNGRTAAISLAVALPVAAMLAYFVLGAPEGLSPEKPQQNKVTAADVEAMVASLAERLKQNPDDAEGWAMLGRSYRVMGRYGESAQAFANAGKLVEENPNLLVEYAEALAAAQKDLAGKPTELLDKALELEPNHAHALFLAGTAAYMRADYAVAIERWQKVMPHLPEGSEQATALRERIEKAKAEQDKANPKS